MSNLPRHRARGFRGSAPTPNVPANLVSRRPFSSTSTPHIRHGPGSFFAARVPRLPAKHYSPLLGFGFPLFCAWSISSFILISVASPSIRNIALLPLQTSLQRFQERIGVSLVSPKLLSSPRFETKIVCI